jgi:N-acyl amino acid synthase FeeM
MTTNTVTRIDAGARAGGTAQLLRGLDTGMVRARTRPDAPGKGGPASIEVPGITRKIRVKIASSRGELEDAFRLLATNYRACGYERPSTGCFRFTRFHVLPTTVILVAKHEDRVVATLSVVPDTKLCGLPMEPVYRAEIAALRQQGRRLAEATSLADQDLGVHEFVRVFKTLIRVGVQYHVRQGGDSWVIAVNPRHPGFYQKVLGFVPLGPRRAYPSVEGHPAEAYLSGVDLLKSHAPEMNREVFGAPLPDSVLHAPRWLPTRVHYFGKRSTQADGRTINALLSQVERYGSPPRWLEDGKICLGRPGGWGIPRDDSPDGEGS